MTPPRYTGGVLCGLLRKMDLGPEDIIASQHCQIGRLSGMGIKSALTSEMHRLVKPVHTNLLLTKKLEFRLKWKVLGIWKEWRGKSCLNQYLS